MVFYAGFLKKMSQLFDGITRLQPSTQLLCVNMRACKNFLRNDVADKVVAATSLRSCAISW